jgi:hypothetical protein
VQNITLAQQLDRSLQGTFLTFIKNKNTDLFENI